MPTPDIVPAAVSTERLQQLTEQLIHSLPDSCAVIVIVAPLAEPAQQAKVAYATNMLRPSAVGILKKTLFDWGIDEKWMHGAR
jgi:hypothetical protein